MNEDKTLLIVEWEGGEGRINRSAGWVIFESEEVVSLAGRIELINESELVTTEVQEIQVAGIRSRVEIKGLGTVSPI